jgi:hypothetical protein
VPAAVQECHATAAPPSVPHLCPPSVSSKADPDAATLTNCMYSHDSKKQDDLARISSCQLLKTVYLIPAASHGSRHTLFLDTPTQ